MLGQLLWQVLAIPPGCWPRPAAHAVLCGVVHVCVFVQLARHQLCSAVAPASACGAVMVPAASNRVCGRSREQSILAAFFVCNCSCAAYSSSPLCTLCCAGLQALATACAREQQQRFGLCTHDRVASLHVLCLVVALTIRVSSEQGGARVMSFFSMFCAWIVCLCLCHCQSGPGQH